MPAVIGYLGDTSIGVWPFDNIIKNVITEAAKKQAPGLDEVPGSRFALNSYNELLPLLNSAGIPGAIQPFAAAQILFETNGLKSHVSKADFNLSGIKWINKPYQHATRGVKAPEGDYYAHYAGFKDWADDYRRVLSIGGSSAAINATDLQDFVNRLHAHGYFTSNPDLYYRGLNLVYKTIPVGEKQQARELTIAKEEEAKKPNGFEAWWQDLPWYGKTGIGVGAGLIILAAVKN